jgi:ABC-2 type transport system permease protein
MFNINEIGIINRIAKNESGEIVKNPLVIIVCSVTLVFAFLNGILNIYIGEYHTGSSDVFTMINLGNEFYITSILCTIVAAFIGVTSVADNKSNSLNILLTKPLYRRDIVLGKFIGNSNLLLIIVLFSYLISSFFQILFYGMPDRIDEFIIRLLSMIFILFIECSLVSGITMLFGLLFRNILLSTGVTVTFFFIEWYANLPAHYEILNWISPRGLYLTTFLLNDIALIDTLIPYLSWLSAALPYIVVMILETILIVLADCFVFIKRE